MAAHSTTVQRGKVIAALLAALGAGLMLMSDRQSWAHGSVAGPARLDVDATGSSLTALPYALGLTALASSVALFAVRRVGRYAVGAVLLGAGAGTVAAVSGKLSGLDAALAAKAAAQNAVVAGSRISGVGNTPWPYVAITGALLVALAGGYTLVRGRAWTGLPSRYETSTVVTEPAANGQRAEPSARDLWDSLNRGADPTA